MALATLGGVPFRIDPDSVVWDFSMKVARKRTVGGTVVQVYGTDLGDMRVSGVFGHGDPSRGDTAGWEDQERFRAQVERWLDASISTSGGRPLRFAYPSRSWDFQVLLKAYTARDGSDAVRQDVATFNPGWSLVLFIVEDSTRQVVAGIKDLYITRLMAGVGWKQSAYNGPLTQAEVDQTLAPFGGDLKAYLADQFNQAAGIPRGNTPSGATPAPTGSGGSVDDWITKAAAALGRTFTASERDALKIVAQHESTNNPSAVNLTDSNARAGHPSKGVMQMIDSTFQQYKLAGYNDIMDPVANIIAAVRYAESRYGSIDNIPGVRAVRAGRAYIGY